MVNPRFVLDEAELVKNIVFPRYKSKRTMTASEINYSRFFFSKSVDYSLVTIYEGYYAFFQGRMIAMTPNGNIYWPPPTFSGDFSLKGDFATFIHELVHVWQYHSISMVLAYC